MFFNVENLFDCRHDSLKNDTEYLPEGRRRWTWWRYQEKQRRVAEVIASVGGDKAPALVGLCEVENDSCLHDLTERSPLRTVGYKYVMTNSDDPRGIDVALLYRPEHFHLLSKKEHNVPVRTIRHDAHARPVLHVTGELVAGDTLEVLVCHWPSRLGGTKASEPLRRLAAEVARSVCDSIRAERARPHIVVMGDLNEPPNGQAVGLLEMGAGLTNLARGAETVFGMGGKVTVKGTYRYKGRWEQLDQILVAGADTTAVLHIYDAPFLLEREPIYGGWRPCRTYYGMRYKGGYSDHLPVYADLDFSLLSE